VGGLCFRQAGEECTVVHINSNLKHKLGVDKGAFKLTLAIYVGQVMGASFSAQAVGNITQELLRPTLVDFFFFFFFFITLEPRVE